MNSKTLSELVGSSTGGLRDFLSSAYPACADCAEPWAEPVHRLAAWAAEENQTLHEFLWDAVAAVFRLAERYPRDCATGVFPVRYLCEACHKQRLREERDRQTAEGAALAKSRVRWLKQELAREGLWPETCQIATFGNSRREVEARNPEAWLQLRGWTEKTGNLWLEGGTGTGKTWAACCVANTLLADGHRACRTTGAQINQLAYKDQDTMISHWKRAKALVLDDLHLPEWSHRGIEVLHDVLDHRHAPGKITLLTANMTSGDTLSRLRRADPQNGALTSAIGERMMTHGGGIKKLVFRGDSLRRETST